MIYYILIYSIIDYLNDAFFTESLPKLNISNDNNGYVIISTN